MNSFLPSQVKLWNALPNEMEQNPSISNLKHFLSTKSLRRKIPPLSLAVAANTFCTQVQLTKRYPAFSQYREEPKLSMHRNHQTLLYSLSS